MAFVVRSERKIDLNQGEINELGPGHYISPEFVKPQEPAKMPFNTYTYRNTENKKNDVPGPGSYEYDDRYEKIAKMLHQSRGREKAEPLYKYLEYNFNKLGPYSLLIDGDSKKAAFGSKDKRFKIDKTVTEVPGPGFYTKQSAIEGSPDTRSVENSTLKITKASPNKKTGSPRRLVTIPAKMQSFGYEVNEKGELVMNQDPDKNIRYRGTKNDTVGPGSYNVVRSKDWVKNSVDWSKGKTHTGSRSNLSTLAHSTDAQTEISHELNSIGANVKKSLDTVKVKNGRERIFKQITENRKKLLSLNNNKDSEALVEKFLFSEKPGPGYYFKEEETKAMSRKPEKFQIFGSSSPRFPGNHLSEIEGSEMGPGYYYKEISHIERMKMEQMKRSIAMKYVSKNSGSAERSKQEKEEMINKLGPGLYEPKIPPKKAVTSIGNFGSLQKRFLEEQAEKESLPGPGSYVSADVWRHSAEKESKQDLVRKYFTRRNEQTSKEHVEKEKFEVPSVGTYENDKLYSMAYQVSQKSNAYQSVIAPFASMQKRFDGNSNKTTDNIGPGMYYKEKKPASQQIFPPFKGGAERSKDPLANSLIPGPGDYNQNNYFDWNKKSFNILYI
jgi:hypothetical protein